MTEQISHPLVADWVVHLNCQGKSGHTQASYARALQHFCRWNQQTYGQAFDPTTIIPRDVHDWKSFQQTVERAKPATINQRLVALSRFFKWAVANEHTRSDPTVSVQGLRRKRRQPKALDEVSLRRLLRTVHAAGNLRDVAMVELLVGTGLRVKELLLLRRGDLTIKARSGQVVVRCAKGELYREVPLTAPVRRALRAYLELRPKLEDGDPLWVGQRGPLRDRSGIWRMLKKYSRQAGLDEEQVCSHVMRHTFATRYLKANPGDLRNLAALLGHASVETTMIYTEPTTEDLAQRMEIVE
jgi:site-specific recombinase XerD